MPLCDFIKVYICLSRFSYVNSIDLADYLSNIMSKPKINFRYEGSLSPRSITEIQRGPLRINNLVDSLYSPQYEQIKLQSSQQIAHSASPMDQKKNSNGEETSILNNNDKTVKKDSQVASNASRAPINPHDSQRTPHKPIGLRSNQYQSIPEEPAQSDFQGRSPSKMNPGQNIDITKEAKNQRRKKKEEKQLKPKPINEEKQVKPAIEEKLIKLASEEKQAKPKSQQKPIKPANEQKDQPQAQQLQQRPKYTFTIAPPPPVNKTEVCCNLFGWCKKEEKPRTYPIND